MTILDLLSKRVEVGKMISPWIGRIGREDSESVMIGKENQSIERLERVGKRGEKEIGIEKCCSFK